MMYAKPKIRLRFLRLIVYTSAKHATKEKKGVKEKKKKIWWGIMFYKRMHV